MERLVNARPYLYLELALLMMGVPLALSTVIPLSYMLPLLWAVTLYCHILYGVIAQASHAVEERGARWSVLRPALKRLGFIVLLPVALTAVLYSFRPDNKVMVAAGFIALLCDILYCRLYQVPGRIVWQWNAVNWSNLRPILLRFALCVVLTIIAVALLQPTYLFSFVCERPAFWAFVMVAYPIFSVIPQEIIFRSFFFQRYASIFPSTVTMVLASGILFGAAHLIFQNWVAPLLCVIGGIFFAHTYAKTKSLALAIVEHALYGCMMFTVGLGPYFYHGAVYSKAKAREPSAACTYISQNVAKVRATIF